MLLARKTQAFLQDGPAWLAGLLALVGVIVYLVQAFWYAHTTIPNLDEGAYLYKGMLFATGQYRPFQLYGVLTNKAPLAFLIPGYVQSMFGPGLQTGRYLAIFFGTLTLVTMWTTARRLGGKWLAAAAVWVFALSPVLIKTYSQAVTQSTIAFLLALVLALSLGERRPAWQSALSGFVAGVMILVRQNMVLVLPLLVLYILWQHGWKLALYAALAGGAVLIFFHILYWPNIMDLWLSWMPAAVQSLFTELNFEPGGFKTWDPSIDFSGRLLSFFQGVRFHFVAVAGIVLGLLMWPKRSDWRSQADFRAAVFLAVLFIGLILMHSWASISNDYCVYCFTPYLAFFNVTAVLLLVLLVRVLERSAAPARQIVLIFAVLLISAGVGFSAFEDLGDGLLNLNVPRLRDGRVLPGFTTLWELLSNKFALQRNFAERIVSTAAGAFLGIALALFVHWLFKKLKPSSYNYGYFLAISVLVFGLLFSPLLAGSAGRRDCPKGTDVIAANEQVGAYLAENIPAGSQVFWNGGLSVTPLLYAPDIKIYAPQINDGYSFRVGGDSQELLKYGFWTEELKTRWLQEADFVIVEGWRYTGMKELLPASEFDELPRSPVQTSCADGSGLRIFRRK
jgi:4-amino-4-deoxy-L-arabinose transferase-like glycosyltransferase